MSNSEVSAQDRLDESIRAAKALADLLACAAPQRDVNLLEGTVTAAAFEIVRHLEAAEAAAEQLTQADAEGRAVQ